MICRRISSNLHGFVVVLCGLAPTADAGEFLTAYENALQYDASLQAARAELASARQNLPIARAGLRPSLSLSFSDTKVEGTRTIDNIAPAPPTITPLDYRAPSRSLTLRAPLYNRDASKKIDSAALQDKSAHAIYSLRQMDLLDRLTKAWLDAATAQQNLQHARTQTDALQRQYELMQRRATLGEGTRLEVIDVLAVLELSRVAISEAQYQLDLAMLTVGQMVGPTNILVTATSLSVRTNEAAKLPPLASLSELQTQAEAASLGILYRRYAVEVADLNIERARAGHYPRLDLVASLSQSANESLSTVNQSAVQQSIGLQLNIPIYSGGSVDAGVIQALADQEKAQAELLVEQQSLAKDVTRFYFAATQANLKRTAQAKAVAAAKLALQAANQGQLAGLSSLAEIVQAQRRLAQSRQDWTQSLQDQLLAHVRLQERVHSAAAPVAAMVDAWLTGLSFEAP